MKVEKRKSPLPVDHLAVAAEQDRREELSRSEPYRRGILAAEMQERRNAEHALSCELANLKRASLGRDVSAPGRDLYDRCHLRVTRAAERVASIIDGGLDANGEVITGEVLIPAWLAPPTPTQEETVVVRASRVAGTYRETRGMGPSGKGIPPVIPGSAADWTDITGSKK
jgi:hypothetical protein